MRVWNPEVIKVTAVGLDNCGVQEASISSIIRGKLPVYTGVSLSIRSFHI